jgi:hydrogenase maturation protein HypF
MASPPTTSMGRLFDAVAAICGVRAAVNYEGQAAAELEAVADLGERRDYPLPLVEAGPERGGALLLDARGLVRAVSEDAAAGAPLGELSARFHNAVAAATAAALEREAERLGIATVVLSGGVFQNRLLLERTRQRLAPAGLRVLVPRRLPPNDGGISYGQAAVAAATLTTG